MGSIVGVSFWSKFTRSLLRRYIIIALIIMIIIPLAVKAQAPAVNSTHFVIYDLANAGQAYDQELDNYLEQGYSTYTGLGMKMAPPCSGNQYTVYVVSQAEQASEAGVTEWYYEYNPSTGQIINACIVEINISAGLNQEWLEHTAYHELVHVSQLAYLQYTTMPQNYPWYIEADAEGTASYYTNQCPIAQDYFQYNQYEYDPYDYSGKPIINMYYYSAFIYWLVANGIEPATIEQNVFAGSAIVNSWLDNYYIQYLLSIVHGQDLCGTTYYPSFQTISVSGNTYSFSISLQGLSAEYYEVQLPATGTIEITASGGSVISNIELNSAFSVTNTTLYMAVVNPTTNSETVTLTISYTPGMMVKIVSGTYNVMRGSLTLELYVTYGTAPVTGTIYVNGTAISASNGYASITLTGITWGTYTVNVTYDNSAALAQVTLTQPTISLITSSTLYLTSDSFGYLVFSINNPNNVILITDVIVSSPPSPTNPFKPMIYFQPGNETVTLNPGTNTVKVYFFTNSTVTSGQGDIYLYNSPSTAITLGYNVVPAQVDISDATYYINGNYTVINAYVSGISSIQSVVAGLSGAVYVNYSTYTITVLIINITPPTIDLIPSIITIAPHWVLVNATIGIYSPTTCPGYPVTYSGEFYVNNNYVGSATVQCGKAKFIWGVLNLTYTGNKLTLTISNSSITTSLGIVPPRITVIDYLWNVTGTTEYVTVDLSVTGPYQYVVFNHVLSNSTIEVNYTLPISEGVLVINTGFNNITISRPTPSISLESPAITAYPHVISVTINITMPPTLAYEGPLNVYINGSLYSSMIINLPPGRSSLVNVLVKPMMPSIYVIDVELGTWSSSNITAASVELLGLSIQAEPLVLIGRYETINITLNDYPPISLPINVTLNGCINETMVVTANASLSMAFNEECKLSINASSYILTSEAVSYWDDLNLWINNTIGYYDGYPLLLNETITAYATFNNGSRVPATVLINGSNTFTPQALGPITIMLSIEYLGITNESEINAYVIPPTYFEAEEILNELGNPPFLNTTIANAIKSGNWGLVNEVVSDYQSSSRSYDPLAQLSRYLLTQAIVNGDINRIGLVSTILRYEILIYVVFTAVITLMIIAIYRIVRAKRYKSSM
ncbi:hypothetical protein [Vulcanisaeta sp. JCM 14467]|uniref:hypothetical protein n=1 Tax=Vulcanisaeta sp. JCM 14467 TaxID=1295370 RepID=UPI0006D2A68B|nr:hypothetical protein [Vulcanisaeta sp. JCM 14467]